MKRLDEVSRDTPLCWISILFPGGSASDPPGLEGRSRHAAELARRGAGGRSRLELDAELDQIGASLEAMVSQDSFGLSTMSLSRHTEMVFERAIDVLCDPAMAADEHDKLVRETRSELDDLRDDDASLAARFFARYCAPGYPYGHPVSVTEQSISRLTVDGARGELAATAVRGSAVLGLAGDIDDAVASRLAAVLEARLPDTAARPLVDLSPPPRVRGRRLILVDKPQRNQSQILFGHLGPAFGSDDFIALLPVEAAFGGMFSSRLIQAIRVERGWSYGASATLFRLRGPCWFRMQLAPAAEVTPDALALSLALYDQLCAGGVTADELEFARSYLIGGHAFSRATPRLRLRDALREALYGLPAGFHDTVPHRIRGLSLADTRAASERWLSPRDLCVVVVATADTMLARLESLGFDDVQVVPYDSY